MEREIRLWNKPVRFLMASVMMLMLGAVPSIAAGSELLMNEDPLEITEFSATVDEGLTNAESFEVTVTFNRPVFNFEFSDINITGDADVSYSGTDFIDGESSYTFTVTHNGDGTLDFLIPENVAEDADENENINSEELSFVLDRTPPSVVTDGIEFLDVNLAPLSDATNQYEFELHIEFDEDIEESSFDSGSLNIFPSDIFSAVRVLNDNIMVLELEVPPEDRDDLIDYTIDINSGIINDPAGNSFDGSETASITYDNTPFTVTFSSDEENFTNESSFDVTINFNKPATDFVANDIDVSNATLSNFTSNIDDDEFTVTVTPDSEGEVTLDLAANATTDAAGNGNEAATPFSITFDETRPEITFRAVEDGAV